MVYPASKLFFVGLKQASKALVKRIENRATTHPRFRSLCVSIGHFWFKMKPDKNDPEHKLKEEQAAQFGAGLMSEFMIFSLLSGIVTYEYIVSLKKEEAKTAALDARLSDLERDIASLKKRTLFGK
eukprot:Filipodium_phascolosomae@DN5928_c0_g1_i1.p1